MRAKVISRVIANRKLRNTVVPLAGPSSSNFPGDHLCSCLQQDVIPGGWEDVVCLQYLRLSLTDDSSSPEAGQDEIQ